MYRVSLGTLHPPVFLTVLAESQHSCLTVSTSRVHRAQCARHLDVCQQHSSEQYLEAQGDDNVLSHCTYKPDMGSASWVGQITTGSELAEGLGNIMRVFGGQPVRRAPQVQHSCRRTD